MDRVEVYPSALPMDTDLLNTNRYAMIGLGVALQALLGTGTVADGLACTPNSPAALNVLIAPGSIYTLTSLDATAYGSLAPDTTDQIVKQGLTFGSTQLSCPAPGTVGQSIVYLIEAQYKESDAAPAVLLYFNASNPAQPFNGPNNTGTAQNTVRKGACALQVKAGTAATTGSQVAPTADAGWTPLWAVTVANGQTQITAENIAIASGAPFIPAKLAQLDTIKTVATAQTITAASSGLHFVGTAAITYNLPLAPSVPNGFRFKADTRGGAALFVPQSGDQINGGVAGQALSAGSGLSVEVTRDDLGGWALSGSIVTPAPSFINASQGIGAGQYLVESSSGPITLTIASGMADGNAIRLIDASGSWSINNVTLVPTGGDTILNSSSNFICDAVGAEDLILWRKAGNWGLA